MRGLQGNTNGYLTALNQFQGRVYQSSVNLVRNKKGTGKTLKETGPQQLIKFKIKGSPNRALHFFAMGRIY